MAAIISPERNERVSQYRRIKYRLELMGYGLTLLYLILLAAGGSRWLGAMTDSSVLFVGAIILGRGLFQLPVDYARYRHDRHFGLSELSAGPWFGDHLPFFVLGLVLQGGLALLFLILWKAAPATWYLWVAAVLVAVVLSLSFVGPWVMSRFITHSTPLPDGELKERLITLSQKAGFPVKGVFVSNAEPDVATTLGGHVSWYGAARRITLEKETLSTCTPDEIEGIMGHELGHVACHHVYTLTLSDVGSAALAFLVPGFALEPLSVLLGLGGLAREALPLLALLFVGVLALVWPLRWAIARKCEREADAYGLRLTGKPEAFLSYWHKIAESGQVYLEPPRWVYYYRYRHPTISERIAAAEQFARRQQQQRVRYARG